MANGIADVFSRKHFLGLAAAAAVAGFSGNSPDTGTSGIIRRAYATDELLSILISFANSYMKRSRYGADVEAIAREIYGAVRLVDVVDFVPSKNPNAADSGVMAEFDEITFSSPSVRGWVEYIKAGIEPVSNHVRPSLVWLLADVLSPRQSVEGWLARRGILMRSINGMDGVALLGAGYIWMDGQRADFAQNLSRVSDVPILYSPDIIPKAAQLIADYRKDFNVGAAGSAEGHLHRQIADAFRAEPIAIVWMNTLATLARSNDYRTRRDLAHAVMNSFKGAPPASASQVDDVLGKILQAYGLLSAAEPLSAKADIRMARLISRLPYESTSLPDSVERFGRDAELYFRPVGVASDASEAAFLERREEYLRRARQDCRSLAVELLWTPIFLEGLRSRGLSLEELAGYSVRAGSAGNSAVVSLRYGVS